MLKLTFHEVSFLVSVPRKKTPQTNNKAKSDNATFIMTQNNERDLQIQS